MDIDDPYARERQGRHREDARHRGSGCNTERLDTAVRQHARARFLRSGRAAASLEEKFGFEIDGSEFSGEIFETVGTLAQFVETKTG